MTVWSDTDARTRLGVAICNYAEYDKQHRLELTVGESIHILKECGDWYYGYMLRNRQEKGIFPKCYVQVKNSYLDNAGSHETVVSKELPITHEVTAVLREWGVIWKDLYTKTFRKPFVDHKLSRLETISYVQHGGERSQQRRRPNTPQGSDFEDICTKMDKLLDWRRMLMSSKLTLDEIKEMKQKVTNEIDLGNARLGLDLVVRDESGNLVNPAENSTISLYRQHKIVAQKIQERESVPKAPKKVPSFSLYVNIRNFVCHVGEDSNILVGLYDPKAGQMISDQYIMKWGNHGMPKNLDLLNNLRVLFTDLGYGDLHREKVYLVCQVIRIGRMDQKEGDTKKQTKGLRRPFGVAVLDVTGVLKETVDTFIDKQEFVPILPCGDHDFLDNMVKKNIAAKEINHKGQGLFLNLQMLNGDLKQVQKEFPHLINNTTAIARKMGFPEVILPGDVRNDLYVTLIHGEFKKGSKTADKNVEVTMTVCNCKGEILQDVISEGAGGEMVSQYKSVIYYHEDKPKWCENVKVMIPLNDFYGSHLKFTFKHRSSNDGRDRMEKNFGISYIKLMCDDGTTLRDTIHDLLVYKIDHKKAEHPIGYLKVPATHEEVEKNIVLANNKQPIMSGALSWNQSDHFQVSTLICSTKLTHNVDLMGMLKWRDNPAGLEDHLKKFMRVEGEELVKSIQDTLDALFNILIQNSNSDLYDTLVFDAIVFVLNVVQSAKYEQFRPVLDVYIKENFSATLAYNKLLVVIKDYIEKAHTAKEFEQDRFIKAMKAMEYIFKFVVRSRILFAALNENRGKSQFEMLLKQVFQTINNLMRNAQKMPTPTAVQGQLLKYLPQTIGDIMTVLDAGEFSTLLVESLEAIPKDRHVFRRLQCMDDIVHTPIFILPECRKILLPVMLSHVRSLVERDQELEISMTILSDIMHLLYQKHVGSTTDDLTLISRTVLRSVIQCVIRMDRESNLVGTSVAVMVAILRQMTKAHYMTYIDSFDTELDLFDFLMEILMVFQDLIKRGVYPSDWNEMIMLQNSVFLQALRYFSDKIRLRFISNFEYALWSNYFQCAIAFMTQDALQLERFSSTKRNKILSRYRDMRRETGFSLLNMWYSLGAHKIRFIPEIVGPFLEMTTIPETELRRKTIPIFFDMMQTEFWENKGSKRKHFDKFESEMITKLDMLVEAGRGDVQYKELFYEIMSKMIESHQGFRTQGVEFVETFQELLQRLLEYRDVINDEIRENKMSCTVNLLNFYRKLNRQEMYIRYINKLCMLHLECDNFTEAACTLMLYARLLKWSDEPLPTLFQSNKYPQALTHRDLKEKLYYDIINYFDKGKMWEKGLELCKELSEIYEIQTFDYVKLSELLRKQAMFYDQIVRPDIIRPEPAYFRVGYFGLGFPSFLQNKVFIHRGKEYEKLLTFTSRIQNVFPTSQLMKTLAPPSEELKNSNSQYLQIYAVNPVMELKPHFRNKKVMDEILGYYRSNEVQQFTFEKKRDESNTDVTRMWIEKTVLYATQPFPGILRWFPVVSSYVYDVSPLEHAIETLSSTNDKLQRLVNAHIADSDLRVDELERILGGVVDAAVNGGITNYKMFYGPDYLVENNTTKDKDRVMQLKEITTNQMLLLQKGLEIHGDKAPENLRPFHEHLEIRFRQMKDFTKTDFGIQVTDQMYADISKKLGLLSPKTPTRSLSIPRHARSEFIAPEINFRPNKLRRTIAGSTAAKVRPNSKPESSTPTPTQRSMSIVNLPSRMTAILNRSSSATSVVKDSSHTKSYTRSLGGPSTLVSPKRNSVEGSTSNHSDDSETSQYISGSSTATRSETSTPTKSDRDSGIIELSQALTPARPLRSENGRSSRPSSAHLKLPPLSSVQAYSVDISGDDEGGDAPPPLPEKQGGDYMNLEDAQIPAARQTTYRDTHRDMSEEPEPAPPLPPNAEPPSNLPPAIPPKGITKRRSVDSSA